jgi:hypothetical protein
MRRREPDVLEALLGDRRVCRVYRTSIDDGQWRLWRTGEPFRQRFTGRFEDDGNTIVGRSEKAEDARTMRPSPT